MENSFYSLPPVLFLFLNYIHLQIGGKQLCRMLVLCKLTSAPMGHEVLLHLRSRHMHRPQSDSCSPGDRTAAAAHGSVSILSEHLYNILFSFISDGHL